MNTQKGLTSKTQAVGSYRNMTGYTRDNDMVVSLVGSQLEGMGNFYQRLHITYVLS
jgi:hypothetical protein